MGLFGEKKPKIGECRQGGTNGKRYGWCTYCYGQRYKSYPTPKGIVRESSEKCSWCSGEGKKWYFTHEQTPSMLYEHVDYKFGVFDSRDPKKTFVHSPHQKRAKGHRHQWRLTHTGADKNYPRRFYECSCGETKVEE